MWGNALPWKKTAETPNIGTPDSTDDMRPGLSWSGVDNLKKFVAEGGVLLTSMNTADLSITFGLSPGMSIVQKQKFKATGTALRTKLVDASSPLVYGYTDNLAVYCFECSIYTISNLANGGGQRPPAEPERMTGRGTKDDPDLPQGRPVAERPELPKAEPWEAVPLTDEQTRNNPAVSSQSRSALCRCEGVTGVRLTGWRQRDRTASSRSGRTCRTRPHCPFFQQSHVARPKRRGAIFWSITPF